MQSLIGAGSSGSSISRVIVVVLDGLRADAIETLDLHHLGHLIRTGASTCSARTVSPSVTAAAMTSLFTGVHPVMHGMRSDRFHIPTPAGKLFPLPSVLADAGIPSFAFIRELPLLSRPLAWTIARSLGVTRATFTGRRAPDILLAARETLQTEQRGLIVMHWPDADIAGHAHGWMSPEYIAAARRLDTTLGLLTAVTGVMEDPSTLLIALADHGGGGMVATNHDSDHPYDCTIPIVLAGGGVTHTTFAPPTSLVDVPTTVLHALGVPIPRSYAGRALTEAFTPVPETSTAYAIAS